jgi:murein L,D-transpeptidase YafK
MLAQFFLLFCISVFFTFSFKFFMGSKSFKHIFFCAVALAIGANSFSQNSVIEIKSSSIKVNNIFSRTQDTLKKQFEAEKLSWPPKEMYVRSFKYDRSLEVWVKCDSAKQFKLFKSYKVCMQSGTMGPKRMEGDYQVPEGFYYIDEFNPNSNYHLALGLNYPNTSDKIISDSLHLRPGGDIYIHGDCVSIGCIPISDGPIEEVYMLAATVKAEGQDFIPVHVFPVRYNNKKSLDYLGMVTLQNQQLQQFAITLKSAFDYFELYKELPVIMIDKSGQYVIN